MKGQFSKARNQLFKVTRNVSLPVTFVILLATDLSAQDYCIDTFSVDENIIQPERGYSRRSNLWLVPGFDRAFIDIGTPTALTISDGTLVPFVGPPLDKDNRSVPEFFTRQNGDVWAFERITKHLYRLNDDQQAFVEIELGNRENITAYTNYGALRPYPNLSPSGHGVPALYVSTGARLEHIFEVTDVGLEPVDVPPDWFRGGYPPLRIDGIGSFLDVQGRMMFRRDKTQDWVEFGRFENIWGGMAQRPFGAFINAQIAVDRTFHLILNDRVMVGRFNDSMRAPSLNYQISGRAIIHPPTGDVLVFPDDPYGNRANQNRPPLAKTAPVLHIASVDQPEIPIGLRASPQIMGPSIYTTSVFHQPTGLTLITHAEGIAAFSQSGLTDVHNLSLHADAARRLTKIGTRYVAHIIGHGFYEITDDLLFREIQFPEVGAFIDLSFSETLNRFLISSPDWDDVYTSTNLTSFQKVDGSSNQIFDFVGDVPSERAAMLVSKASAYLVRSCDFEDNN